MGKIYLLGDAEWKRQEEKGVLKKTLGFRIPASKMDGVLKWMIESDNETICRIQTVALRCIVLDVCFVICAMNQLMVI